MHCLFGGRVRGCLNNFSVCYFTIEGSSAENDALNRLLKVL